jgi:hypothetical protein
MLASPFRLRKIAAPITLSFIRFLQMDGERVVDAGLHPALFQPGADSIAVVHVNYKKVLDALTGRATLLDLHTRACQGAAINLR